jgi:hypothetical protein
MKTTPGGLVTLLATQGWPGQALVGEEGAQAAWLLAQHADHHPDLQQAFLDALRSAVVQGEASPAHLAYLEAGYGFMPASLSYMAPSSPLPTANLDPTRSKIHNAWTRGARKPGSNHSLPPRPACGLSRS